MSTTWRDYPLTPNLQGTPNAIDASRHDWQLLRIYTIYRALLSASILAFLLTANIKSFNHFERIGLEARVYFWVAAAYFALCMFAGMIAYTKLGRAQVQAFIAFLIDTAALTLLQSIQPANFIDLTLLQLVAVAAGSLILRGHMPYLLAAIASLSILASEVGLHILNNTLDSNDLMHAGLMGASMFATALFTRQLAVRLRESEALTEQQAENLASLEALNHHIIQRMRTGILVVNAKNHIVMMNDSCWRLFNMPTFGEQPSLERFSVELRQQLDAWRNNDLLRGRPFRTFPNGPEVLVNFTLLESSGAQGTSDILIFVDDNTRLVQQAQQLKLASLGGLTASIAHEIRNPLGAISHAAQLLAESKGLDEDDIRLTNIIQQHSLRMNRVIENVLQLSRRRPTLPERADLCAWIHTLIDDYKATCSDPCEIILNRPDTPLWFFADRVQMQQVLENLIQNGLRYSDKQTGHRTLTINVGLTLLNEQAFVEIIDQGPGIPAELADKIFEPFYTSERSGTGLGLYIARELCESNQARLDLVPIKSGSCFRITFAHPGKQMAL
ncbi:Sensor kinase, type IV fimbriae [gamma proteobacterium HdN1]|nr:Sensor kinase, type IV fimbriae [gamma proteobacterium HdN1]